MIVARMNGGLGNQMFQYALASILARKNKAIILLETISFNQTENRLGHTPRKFELAVFDNPYTFATSVDILFFKQLSAFNKIKRELGLNYPKMYRETSFRFDENLLNVKTPVYLRGYFQSYKYLIGNENWIRKVFAFPVDTLDEQNKKVMATINSTNGISIHVRRGDYVSNPVTQQYHGNCSLEYYTKAIALLAEKSDDFVLFFFSDDCDWVKEQFGDLPFPKQFIDHNKGDNSWKDMLLMSLCQHNIIANSSFSWWAAWLNQNTKKVVVAPKEWFAATELQKKTEDLIPTEWIRL